MSDELILNVQQAITLLMKSLEQLKKLTSSWLVTLWDGD